MLDFLRKDRDVLIGPKSRRSEIPVGKVSRRVYEEIQKAEVSQLGKQIYNFNLYLGAQRDNAGVRQDVYYKAFVVNGHCRFKRYSLLDLALHKFFGLFRRG